MTNTEYLVKRIDHNGERGSWTVLRTVSGGITLPVPDTVVIGGTHESDEQIERVHDFIVKGILPDGTTRVQIPETGEQVVVMEPLS